MVQLHMSDLSVDDPNPSKGNNALNALAKTYADIPISWSSWWYSVLDEDRNPHGPHALLHTFVQRHSDTDLESIRKWMNRKEKLAHRMMLWSLPFLLVVSFIGWYFYNMHGPIFISMIATLAVGFILLKDRVGDRPRPLFLALTQPLNAAQIDTYMNTQGLNIHFQALTQNCVPRQFHVEYAKHLWAKETYSTG